MGPKKHKKNGKEKKYKKFQFCVLPLNHATGTKKTVIKVSAHESSFEVMREFE